MEDLAAKLNVDVPHPARRYNYWLGGKDHFAADRESAIEIEKAFPGMRAGVLANRAFLIRATRFLTEQAGIRQFLDIGTGLPTADNTHEVAQRIAPRSRVVYVDNDPLVMTHARALLLGTEEGATSYIEADLRDPDRILEHPGFTEVLDLAEPVALMLIAVMHFVPGEGAVQPIVDRLMSALPSGSYLAATHFTVDFLPQPAVDRYREMQGAGRLDLWARGRAEFEGLFEGLELVDPGVVLASEWRPGADDDRPLVEDVSIWSGVGRKP